MDQTPLTPHSSPQPERATTYTVVLCLIFATIAALWARQVELIGFAAQVTESIPPMTALGLLILAVLLAALLRRVAAILQPLTPGFANLLRSLSISGRQSLYVYAFVMIASIVFSVGVVRTILPELTSLVYFADNSNDYAEAARSFHPWLHVTDPEAVRQYYEGSDTGLREPSVHNSSWLTRASFWVARPWLLTRIVPWSYWWLPLLFWGLFICALFLVMDCLAGLMEREWTLAERLPYPLVEIPLGLTETTTFVKGLPILRDPLLWIGFAIGTFYGIHETVAASTLAFPQWGRQYSMSGVFTEYPLSILRGQLDLFIMPEAYGLAYFASQDVLLSTAVTWVGFQAIQVALAGMGRRLPGNVAADVSLGNFIAFVVAAVWLARKPLLQAARQGFGLIPMDDDTRERAWLVRGLFVGLLLLCVFLRWIGLPYPFIGWAILLMVVAAIGHARVRAMAGAATPWLFPHSAMTNGFVRLFGSRAIGVRGAYKPFTALFHLKWIDRGYVHSAMAAQVEGYNMARQSWLSFGNLRTLMMLAVPVGFALGIWYHLTCYYDAGANVLEGGAGTGGARVAYANYDAKWAIGLINQPTVIEKSSWISTGVGALLVLAFTVLRTLFLRFPLHPAGLVIGMNHGSRFWAPFLLIWLLKGILLRIGGVGIYRRLMPAFLGLVIGHYSFTGIIMGWLKVSGISAFENLPIIWF